MIKNSFLSKMNKFAKFLDSTLYSTVQELWHQIYMYRLAWQNINSGLYTSLNPWNDVCGKHFYLIKDYDTFLKRQHILY